MVIYMKKELRTLSLKQKKVTISKLHNKHYEEYYELKEKYTELLKRWINLSLKEITELRGGFSGVKVNRVKPELSIPIYDNTYHIHSLIIKSSDKETFEKEKSNFKKIPNNLKQYFSKITDNTPYIPTKRPLEVCLIMEDLINYHTLEEKIKEYLDYQGTREKKESLKKLLQNTCSTLEFIYDTTRNDNSNNDEIIVKYFSYIYKIIPKLISHKIIRSKLIDIMNFLNKKITDNDSLKIAYGTIMHGDLNTRNIMIRQEKVDFNLKLIDIDHFSKIGDYAFDIGELSADILTSFLNGKKWSKFVEDYFFNYSRSINDNTFSSRLKLSKIYSILKLISIKLKRSYKEDEIKDLIDVVNTLITSL